MHTDIHRMEYLLARYSEGTATAEESTELETLLLQAELRPIVIDILTKMAAESNITAHISESELEKGAAHILHRPTKKVMPLRRIWLTAASIALLLTVGTMYYINRQHPVKAPTVTVAQVVPGKDGAILTLADGSQVSLDSAANGTVAAQNGQTIVKKNGQLVFMPNEAGDPNTFTTVSTPKGRQIQLVLPDGTKAWLNAASTLLVPTKFDTQGRVVNVQGEAYFEVAKLTMPGSQQRMPFRVITRKNVYIEVLGTHFNIQTYENDNSVKATLAEGSVKVFAGNKATLIKPGEQAVVVDNQQGIEVKAVDIDEVLAWKNGTFMFKHRTPVTEVLKQIARWYDVEVVYPNGQPTAVFEGEMQRDLSFDQVVKGLSAMGLDITIEGRKLIVRQ